MIYFITLIFFLFSPFSIIIFCNISLAMFLWFSLGSEFYRLICIFLCIIFDHQKLFYYTSRSRTSLHQLASKCCLASLQRKLSPSDDSGARPMESLYSRPASKCGFGRAAKMTLRKRDLVRYRSCFPVRNPRLRSPLRRRW